MSTTLTVTKARVILDDNGGDRVELHTQLPCPYVKAFLPCQPPLVLRFEATYDTGIDYCRNVFGREPEVLNLREEP